MVFGNKEPGQVMLGLSVSERLGPIQGHTARDRRERSPSVSTPEHPIRSDSSVIMGFCQVSQRTGNLISGPREVSGDLHTHSPCAVERVGAGRACRGLPDPRAQRSLRPALRREQWHHGLGRIPFTPFCEPRTRAEGFQQARCTALPWAFHGHTHVPSTNRVAGCGPFAPSSLNATHMPGGRSRRVARAVGLPSPKVGRLTNA